VLVNSASRILSLALLTLIINKQGWPGLLLFVAPLGALFFQWPHHGRQILLLARKLRWFFLSIVILYFWFYPGMDLLPSLGRFSPSVEGVNQAALRISSLLVVISYSGFLLLLTPRDDLVSGIQFLLSPLGLIGIDSHRFALRLGLVLSIVPQMSEQLHLPGEKKKINNVSELIDRAADMIKSASEQANHFELNDTVNINIEQPSHLGITDILVPLFLLIWLIFI
jgi:energy-coupling factor transport system permease protein